MVRCESGTNDVRCKCRVLLRVCAFALAKRWIFLQKWIFSRLQFLSYSYLRFFLCPALYSFLRAQIISISGYWFYLHFEFRSKQKWEVIWSQDTYGYRLCWNLESRFTSVTVCVRECRIMHLQICFFRILVASLRFFSIEYEWREMIVGIEW